MFVQEVDELIQKNIKLNKTPREAVHEAAELGYRTAKKEAAGIINRMLPLLPNGYNDMGNGDFIWEVKEEAKQFLKGC